MNLTDAETQQIMDARMTEYIERVEQCVNTMRRHAYAVQEGKKDGYERWKAHVQKAIEAINDIPLPEYLE